MSNEVFANGREISCKSGDGKSICEFPDVCMTPPTSPATPMGIPVPYPNTGFSRDTTKGSRTVKIDKKEVMLRDKSYYKTSTGDEAGCATPAKKGIITGTIKGKIYFISWSPNVKIEGKNVVRTADMTTHNHSSYPGNGSIPTTDVEGVKLALKRLDKKCPCCGGEKHATGKAMNRNEWYNDNLEEKHKARTKEITEEINKAQKSLDAAPSSKRSPARKRALKALNIATKKQQKASKSYYKDKEELHKLIKRAKQRRGCECPKPPPPLLPTPPCDVFFKKASDPEKRKAEHATNETEWNNYKISYKKKKGIPTSLQVEKQLKKELKRDPTKEEIEAKTKVNHLTPKSAGGCPTGDNNLQHYAELCSRCQGIDDDFNPFQ